MAKKLELALTEWFWSDIEAHRGDSAKDKQANLTGGHLTALVTRYMRDYFQRYLRLWVMEQAPNAGGEEREQAFRDNLPKLEPHIEFYGQTMTDSLQTEFVYIHEELDEKQPKNPKRYIGRKIEKLSKQFFSDADDLAEDVLNGSPKVNRAAAQLSAALEPREIVVRLHAGLLRRLEQKAKRMGYALKNGMHRTVEDFAAFVITQYVHQQSRHQQSGV